MSGAAAESDVQNQPTDDHVVDAPDKSMEERSETFEQDDLGEISEATVGSKSSSGFFIDENRPDYNLILGKLDTIVSQTQDKKSPCNPPKGRAVINLLQQIAEGDKWKAII